jgi:predicted DNA-binding protein
MMNITVRSKKEMIKELDDLAILTGQDRAQLLRHIIKIGIEKEKMVAAINLYQEGDSLELSAEKAKVNLWDLIEQMHLLGISTRFNLDEEKVFFSNSLEENFPDLSKRILD